MVLSSTFSISSALEPSPTFRNHHHRHHHHIHILVFATYIHKLRTKLYIVFLAMDPTISITTTTEAFLADFTSALVSNSHALYARDERSVTVDVITVSASIIGVFIAVVGLIQGYKYWKHNCNHDVSKTV